MAIPHAYGRLQFGEDLDLHFRTMIGTGANPNVAAVVVIGIEPGWTKVIADGIREDRQAGQPNSRSSRTAISKPSGRRAGRPRNSCTGPANCRKEPCPISDLWVSTKCGESDTTTGLSSCPTVGNMYDKLLPAWASTGCFRRDLRDHRRRAHLRETRRDAGSGAKFKAIWQAYQDDVIFAHQTDDLSDSQPTKGNILGGLTTIEEKALGNLEKIGRTSSYIDALWARRRRRRKGTRLSTSWTALPRRRNA